MTTRVIRLMLGLSLLAGLVVPAAASAADTPFGLRFVDNDYGDIRIAGNTLMTCPAHCAAEGGVGSSNALNNNGNVMTYVDVDGDATTFDSSTATLNLPAGARIRWAGLYWGADTSAGAGGGVAAPDASRTNRVKLGVPGGDAYQTLTASRIMTDTPGVRFHAFADVTALVSAAGGGIYRVADVQAGTGNDRYGGWSLVVAYHDDAAGPRNLSIFDGFVTVDGTHPTATIPLSGFRTPMAGAVNTTLGAVTYEGDLGLTGDSMDLNGTQITDARNPSTNVFNSTISSLGTTVTDRNPSQFNTFGFDADMFNASGILANSATSATLHFTTGGEAYYPGVFTFSTQQYAPKVRTTTTVNDLNGGNVEPGDVLEYVVTGTNTGDDAASGLALTSSLPSAYAYVPGSLAVTAGAGTGAQSDAAADDLATYDAAGSRITWNLGTGATPSAGGTLNPSAGFTVVYRVTVGAVADGTTLTSANTTTFKGAATNDDYNVTGTGGTVTVHGADLRVDVNPGGLFVRGADSSYLLVVDNVGSGSTHGPVTVTDDLPSGLTLAGAPSGTGWDCSATTGTHVSCTRSDTLAPSAAYPSITVPVSVAATAPGPIHDVATVTGGGDVIHTNDAGDDMTTVVSQSDLSVSLASSPDGVRAGGTTTVTATVSNAGPSPADSTVVTFTIPAGMHLESATVGGVACTGLTCTVGTVASGGTADAVLVVRADDALAPGTVLNVGASVASASTDASAGNDAATAGVPVFGPADVAVTLRHDGDIVAGTTATWTAAVRNDGPNAASGVTITVPIPAGLTDVTGTVAGLPGTCVAASGVLTCTLPAMLPAAAATIEITGHVPSNAGGTTLTLSAQASADQPDPDGTDDAASDSATVTALADLTVESIAPSGVVPVGGNVAYTLQVTNNGPSDAADVVVTQTLPIGAVLVDLDDRCTQTDRVVTCALGTVPNGTSLPIVLHVHAEHAFDGAALGLLASVHSPTPDANAANDALATSGNLICLSRRRFTIHLRLPNQGRLRNVSVKVGERYVPVHHGRRLTAVVDLRGRQRSSRVVVTIKAQKGNGRWIVGYRAYKTCHPRILSRKAPRI